MNILICDDDLMILKTTEIKLKRDGYDVTTASNGKIAQEYIESNDYDLILLDLLMPFVNGLEIIELLKKKLNKTTPVIVLSSVGLEETVIRAFDLGADDYVVKPFSPNELSLRIKRLLIQKNK
ncbi:MAG: response regulator transcription factor [Bacteroidales bacterium]|nr:response regulator transcription factor [Bacteroidales bacterium]